jgi:hypothetical protein
MAGLVISAAVLALVLFCLAGGLWGADSRPGLGDERIDPKVRWFFHSKTD